MTIKDIAQLSGYGIGTVSRVINNHPDVSDKARKRIMEVIEETNFQPNSNAKHLKMRASSSIAIIIKGNQNILFNGILEQIQQLLLKNNEEAVVSYLDEDANEINYATSLCREKNPKGIFFLGGDLEYFERDFKHIHVPCVLLTNSGKDLKFPNLSSLTTDDATASEAVIDYLVDQGHTNIGILGGNLSDTQVSYKRLTGCIAGFKKHHLDFQQDLQFEPCRYSIEEGYEATLQLLKRNPSLTAIFAFGDIIAFGAMRAIRDLGKRIPEDISLVGYDGIDFSRFSIPRLTTIRQDTSQMAKQGVDLMLQRIHYPYKAVHKIIPYELVKSESVKKINEN